MSDADPVAPHLQAFANRIAGTAAQTFTQPPLDGAPPVGAPLDNGPLPMPPAPRAVFDDEQEAAPPHPDWPGSTATFGGMVTMTPAPTEPDLIICGSQGTYKGQAAILNDQDQAAVGRIVLEAARRVILEHLDAAKKLAPRRRMKATEQPQSIAPKPRRGRPPKKKETSSAQENPGPANG